MESPHDSVNNYMKCLSGVMLESGIVSLKIHPCLRKADVCANDGQSKEEEANLATATIFKCSSFAKRGIFVFMYIQSLVFLMWRIFCFMRLKSFLQSA